QNDVTLKMPAFEWVHVQLHQQKGMISLSPPTICNSAFEVLLDLMKAGIQHHRLGFEIAQQYHQHVTLAPMTEA
ncbi:hypothetical protein, partial [Klebsiella pneumoniae]|uniref:hypothetical protein n=1 Tax=Klebsiella pneumoniae TaxID=573 RepID=UPI003F7A9E0A